MVETPEMRNMYNMFHQYAVKHSMTAEMKLARMDILEKIRFVLCNEKRRDEPPTWATSTTIFNGKAVNTTPLYPLPAARATFVDAMSSELTRYLSRTVTCITWFECPTDLSNAIQAAVKEIESSVFFDYLSRRGPLVLMNKECPFITVATWITATSPSWMRILTCSTAGIDRTWGRSQLRRELRVALDLRETDLIAPAFALGLERVAALRRRLMETVDDVVRRMVIERRFRLALEPPTKQDRLERHSGKRSPQLRRILGIQSTVRAGYEYKEAESSETDGSEE